MISINKVDVKNKIVLIRVDFNVPLDEEHNVIDDTRIKAALPTIIHVLDNGGACVIISHLGRPKQKEHNFSLFHIKSCLEKNLKRDVIFHDDCIGKKAERLSKKLRPGEVLLLENLRFYPQEVDGNLAFSEKLSKHGEIYVNDAFGAAHRAHASTSTIAQFFKVKCLGLLLKKEISAINKITKKGKPPVLAILGGAKISSKITIIENILDKVDNIIIGGGMAYTFIKANGGNIGDSIFEEEYLEYTREISKKAIKKNVKIFLPIDVVIADRFSNDAIRKLSKINEIPLKWMGLDSGPETLSYFKDVILQSKTILWNGPLGVFEFNNFAEGTVALGRYIMEATKKGSFSLVGGGDSVAAVKKYGFDNKVSYVSTGGGAMLECLEGKTLPGIKALM